MKRCPLSVTDRRRRSREGAILSMELILVLPIFLVLLFAVVEFTMLMSARAHMCDVARAASRHMSLSGCADDQTTALVRQLLGPALASDCRVSVMNDGGAGSPGNVRIDLPMQNAAPDLLWIIGFGLQERVLSVDAPVIMERDVASSGIRRL